MTAIKIPSGSPAAGLTRPPAQRGRAVNAQSDRAEHREPRSGALDRPAARSYPAAVPSTPTHMSPEPGCVIHAQISEKDSDARHDRDVGGREAGREDAADGFLERVGAPDLAAGGLDAMQRGGLGVGEVGGRLEQRPARVFEALGGLWVAGLAQLVPVRAADFVER